MTFWFFFAYFAPLREAISFSRKGAKYAKKAKL
jgi:hypothetical protein